MKRSDGQHRLPPLQIPEQTDHDEPDGQQAVLEPVVTLTSPLGQQVEGAMKRSDGQHRLPPLQIPEQTDHDEPDGQQAVLEPVVTLTSPLGQHVSGAMKRLAGQQRGEAGAVTPELQLDVHTLYEVSGQHTPEFGEGMFTVLGGQQSSGDEL
jgi:hypothetical protein